MFCIGRRLDIYFIKNLMLRRAHEQFAESMRLTIDQDEYIMPKALHKVKKSYEDDYSENVKLIKKEFKRIIKVRKKKAKAGEIDQNEEIAIFLQSVGVEFHELYQEEQEEEPAVETVESKAEIGAEPGENEKAEEEGIEQETEQEQGEQAE